MFNASACRIVSKIQRNLRQFCTQRTKKLGFGITPVNGHIIYTWNRGSGWDSGKVVESPYINLHVNAGVLHYGLSCFEGLKAFEAKNGKHYICNPRANAARMQEGAERLVMPQVPEEIFMIAVRETVKINREHIPAYKTGGALYIRPLLFASGPMLPLKAPSSYSFMVTVTPVGNYFSGSEEGISAAVVDLDRAAPRGTGHVKAAGNYASDMYGLELARQAGCDTSLYLDAKYNRYIEEFSVANFVGIKDGVYVTPKTESVLPSLTNKMLMELARNEGIRVSERQIDFEEEIADFSEVAGSGTAVVLSPISRIRREGQDHKFGKLSVLADLRDRLVRIQRGEEADIFNWMEPVMSDVSVYENAATVLPKRDLPEHESSIIDEPVNERSGIIQLHKVEGYRQKPVRRRGALAKAGLRGFRYSAAPKTKPPL